MELQIRSMPKLLFPLAVLLGFLGLAGCGTIPRNPVPIEQLPKAEIPEMPGVRTLGGERSPAFTQDFIQSVRDEPPDLFPPNPDGTKPYFTLILSGGGPNGAFGAGFLNGWTRAGTRPTFKLVTGVSAGGLLAPFAFVGSDYDPLLQDLWTSIRKKNIFRMLLGRESFGDSRPLAELIAQRVDDDLIEAVARAHARGRRLYLGTTNFDAQRLVIWNMGAIAHSGHPDSLELFRKVMLASASIPVAMPPVMFEVEADGMRYDEMHVDGGAVSQLFFTDATIDLLKARRKLGIKAGGGHVYIIRNGYSDPRQRQVERNLKKIMGRTLSTLMTSHAIGDINRIYTDARARNIGFSYVGIPVTYVSQKKGLFDTSEMQRLFTLGENLGASKNPWRKTPPHFEEISGY